MRCWYRSSRASRYGKSWRDTHQGSDLLRELFFLEKDKDEICRERGVDREYLRVLLHRAKTRFRMEFVAREVPKRAQSAGKQKA